MHSGTAPFTALSCDNLTDNGTLLERSVVRLAEQTDPALAEWIAQHATFPRSMVDSITPATDDALRMRVQDQLGVHDAWPIQRERYSQWVIEDRFCNGRPAFERAGVTLSEDLAGYARAKLRLLNAPHSALAYLGSLLQLETVADAMRHSELAAFVETSMRAEIAPTLQSMEALMRNATATPSLPVFAIPPSATDSPRSPGTARRRYRYACSARSATHSLPASRCSAYAWRLPHGCISSAGRRMKACRWSIH